MNAFYPYIYFVNLGLEVSPRRFTPLGSRLLDIGLREVGVALFGEDKA